MQSGWEVISELYDDTESIVYFCRKWDLVDEHSFYFLLTKPKHYVNDRTKWDFMIEFPNEFRKRIVDYSQQVPRPGFVYEHMECC